MRHFSTFYFAVITLAAAVTDAQAAVAQPRVAYVGSELLQDLPHRNLRALEQDANGEHC